MSPQQETRARRFTPKARLDHVSTCAATWDQNGLIGPEITTDATSPRGIIINSDDFATHEEAAGFICDWMAKRMAQS